MIATTLDAENATLVHSCSQFHMFTNISAISTKIGNIKEIVQNLI